MSATDPQESCCVCWKTYALCFMLLVGVLFRVKSPIQYYVKFVVYFCLTMFMALISMPFVCLRPCNPKNIE